MSAHELFSRLLNIALALTTSNFIYQAATDFLWVTAVERSIFQIAAIFCVGVMLVMDGRALSTSDRVSEP